MKFDHVVAAKSYIGCLASGAPPADTTPPTVSITAPAAGATVSGSGDRLGDASDNVGVAGVQFKARRREPGRGRHDSAVFDLVEHDDLANGRTR